MNGWMDRWIDEQMDGWMDGWMDEQNSSEWQLFLNSAEHNTAHCYNLTIYNGYTAKIKLLK